jgi:hypothetical protein
MGARELWLNVVQPWQQRRLTHANGGDEHGVDKHSANACPGHGAVDEAAPQQSNAVKSRVSQD